MGRAIDKNTRKFLHARERLSGIVTRHGLANVGNRIMQSVLVENVTNSSGELFFDHLWIIDPAFDTSAIDIGNVVTFVATITTYRSGYRRRKRVVNGAVEKKLGVTDVQILFHKPQQSHENGEVTV